MIRLGYTTENIELGAKLTLLDNRLTVNAALFRVDWDNLPITFLGNGNVCSVTNNIGSARSQGIEWDVNYAVTSSLSFNLSAAYIEAEVTDDPITPDSVGKSLSFSPRSNAGVGVQYDFDLGLSPTFIRADVNYIGQYWSNHAESRVPVGDYVDVNVRAGIAWDNMSLSLYAKNLTNEDTVLRYFGFTEDTANTRVIPRRIGLELNYTF